MDYTLYNFKGDVLNESLSQEELDTIIESGEYNLFQFDESIFENFLQQEHTDAEVAFNNFRVYKPIYK